LRRAYTALDGVVELVIELDTELLREDRRGAREIASQTLQ